MRLAGLAAYDLAPAGLPVQVGLFGDEKRGAQRRLDRTLDTLKERFGENAIHWGDDSE